MLKTLASLLYHVWFYNSKTWTKLTWMGTTIYKSPMDLWNYQEILYSLKPGLIVEFGTWAGGSAKYFATVMRSIGQPFKVLSVDIDQSSLKVNGDGDISFMLASSLSAEVAAEIKHLRILFPGPVFAILDSDHSKTHVLAEMIALRPLLRTGDYLIVEDGNINGHPVYHRHGPGPYEAIRAYFRLHPEDYARDREREEKFGFTHAPRGFLIRR